MSDCSVSEKLLSLAAGGDLRGEQGERLRAHLGSCEPCRIQMNQFLAVISVGRDISRVECQLAEPVRRRIAAEAAMRASHRRWGLPRLLPVPSPGRQILAGAAAILALGFFLFTMRSVAPRADRAAAGRWEAVAIEVAPTEGGGVRLAWRDGEKGSYTVYKSTDPRKIGLGEAHHVRGNVWVDRDAGSSPVVYYAIE